MTRTEIKQFYTDQIREKLSLVDIEVTYSDLWYNISKTGGLRLTDKGYLILNSTLEIETHSFSLMTCLMKPKLYFLLDKMLKGPYYIAHAKKKPVDLILFSGEEAMMITLYGDLECFLESYKL